MIAEHRDEDAWAPPADWWDGALPWRGLTPPGRAGVSEDAVVLYRDVAARFGHRVHAALDERGSDPDLVEQANRHLGRTRSRFAARPAEPNPLGAAVAAGVLAMATQSRHHRQVAGMADAWVAAHGLPFAAEAGVLLTEVQAVGADYWPGWWPDGKTFPISRPGSRTTRAGLEPYAHLTRLRALLAAADDEDYDEAVRRVGELRALGAEARVAASFLFPTQRGWVAADVHEALAGGDPVVFGRLFGCISTRAEIEQLRPLLPHATVTGVNSAIAYAGPAAAPLVDSVRELRPDWAKSVADALAVFPTEEAFGLLLARLDEPHVQPAVMAASRRFPRRALRMLAEAAAAGNGTAATFLRGHVVSHPELVGSAEVSSPARNVLVRVAAEVAAVVIAPAERVPALLADPPWAGRRKPRKPAVVEGLVVPAYARVPWLPGEREEFGESFYSAGPIPHFDEQLQWALEGRMASAPLLVRGPEELVRPLLAVENRDRWYQPNEVGPVLARFSGDALDWVLGAVDRRQSALGHILAPVEAPRIAMRMATWAVRNKTLRPTAHRWFLRHPEAAVEGLLPTAVGRPGKERAYAETALRFLAGNGERDTVDRVAKAAGPAVQEAVEEALAVDPLTILPARMPELPDWLDPAYLPPVRLADRSGALPRDAVVNLCLVLALCKPGDTYAGVETVRAELDAGDLAGFAWAVFECWRAADHPPKDFVLEALGLLGDDEVARRLVRYIRAWSGDGGNARALAGVDALAAIGTEVALMHLNGLTLKTSFKTLRTRASERIAELADSLDLTPDQLSDRLVPDLGLDASGGLLLDYGPRQFSVALDEQLRPAVFDADGSRRRALPKPAAADDAVRAAAAYARFADLKKDLATPAADQVTRLERAMVAGRRWTAAEHRLLFVDHALLWNLTRRLVWVVVDGAGRPCGSFRVAEDRTYAGSTDSALELAADARAGIAHPLHLGDELAAWSAVFADYEILQPFAQLARDTYAGADLARFEGAVVPTRTRARADAPGLGARRAVGRGHEHRDLPGPRRRRPRGRRPGPGHRGGRGHGGAGADPDASAADAGHARRPRSRDRVGGPARPHDAVASPGYCGVMRSFTFAGGSSNKFWEIGRDGTTVTVRFGRIGTNGQTRTKELGSEQSAREHVEKLVAEKVAKGYVEGAAAGSTSPDPQSDPPMPAPGPGPAPVAEHDEDTWTVPASWWRQAEPWRGVSPPRTVAVDPLSAADYRRILARSTRRIEQVLDDPASEPDLVEATNDHLGRPRRLFRQREPKPNVLGAAVVGGLTGMLAGWRDRESVAGLADEWIAGHGLAFAAEAGALLAGVHAWVPAGYAYYHSLDRQDFAVRRAGPGTTRATFDPYAVLARLRAFLAITDDGTYREAVRRLEAARTAGPEVRRATSFLLPTQRNWVAADIAEAVAGGGPGGWRGPVPILLACAATADQVRDVLSVVDPGQAAGEAGMLYSAAAYAGPAIAPLLDPLYDAGGAEEQKRLVAMLAQFPTDEAYGLLLARLDQRYVQPAVGEATARSPRRALRMLAGAATGPGPKAVIARELIRGVLVSNPGLAESVELSGTAAAAVAKVAAGVVAVETAPPEAVPPLLARPPWQARRKTAKPAVVEGLTARPGLELVWAPGERERWADPKAVVTYPRPAEEWKRIAHQIESGRNWNWSPLAVLAQAPEDVVRPWLHREVRPDSFPELPWLKLVLGRFGDEAAPYALRETVTHPQALAAGLLPVRGAQVAPHMAEWLARRKSIRTVAQAWLLRHPQAAAEGLLPTALGSLGKERRYAEAALRFLAANGNREAIDAAAKAAGPAAQEAVEALLAVDPVDILPARMPALPAWLDPAHLPPVRLADASGALPREAVANLCLMLALCKPGETYAGVDVVRPALDAGDLAAFAWGIFERWRGAEYPSRDGWVLEALGLLGDDETVRRLTPLIRTWPGEGASARATTALEVLSAIGTDVALMHLHSISEKVSFKGLKAKAAEKIAEIADGLGLTKDQLADRLVPDLGLDANGGMLLDYGPRQFRVGFDEQLKPIVLDADGSRRKLLPKPAAKDDAALAEGAYARFAGLKKDVKTIAADQIKRLERAMVAGRRWPADEHRRLFVSHPLLTHLAARLVWLTVGQDGVPTGSFRVAEDRTYADSTDSELEVADGATVGIAHPLHLDAATLAAWAEAFADYEILQPFAQLGRDTYALTDDERARTELVRFHGTVALTGRVLGLAHRGWERGTPMDAGVSGETYRHLGDDLYVVVDLDPGIIAGAAMEEPRQTLTRVWLSRGAPSWGRSQGTDTFGSLDVVTASEVLRDLEMLRG